MLKGSGGSYTVGFSECRVEVTYNNDAARELLHFLFQDLLPNDGPIAPRSFDVVFSGDPVQMSLWQGEKRLYFGQSRYALAVILTNEVVFECISINHTNHAVHAAALVNGGRAVLFPGQSGSGKSSLAAWLILQGWSYLTDELVFLTDDGLIRPFTRPLSLRPATVAALKSFVDVRETECLVEEAGAMIPHRHLNPDWQWMNPKLSVIIFPTFVAHHPATLTPISQAQGCMQLLGCHVNARNLSGHGFSEMARLVRGLSVYELKYGSFSDVLPTLQLLVEPAQQQ
jgi:hypothetical protein